MPYAAAHRSARNPHAWEERDYRLGGWYATKWVCVRCGAEDGREPFQHDRPRPPRSGCVALPTPAVSAPGDALPIPAQPFPRLLGNGCHTLPVPSEERGCTFLMAT